MEDDWRFSPGGVAAIVVIILAAAGVAYYMGRFGEPRSSPAPVVERPDAGPPAPSVDEHVPTPAEVPPTVTPSLAVVIEKGPTTTSGMQQRSTQIDVLLPPSVPTAARYPTVIPTAAPPTARPEPEREPEPPQPTAEPHPQEATPTPLPPAPHEMPTPGKGDGKRGQIYFWERINKSVPIYASIWSLGRAIAFSFAPRSTQTKQDL